MGYLSILWSRAEYCSVEQGRVLQCGAELSIAVWSRAECGAEQSIAVWSRAEYCSVEESRVLQCGGEQSMAVWSRAEYYSVEQS